MASTYSDRLKLELMETGANANTWGNNTNTNLQTLDAFTAGYLSKDVAGSANVTLTSNNADPTAESSNKVIEFTGTLTGNIYVFIPAVENNYIFYNNTSGAFTVTIAPDGHAANGVAITQGAHTIMYNTASNEIKDLFAGSLGNLSLVSGGVFTGNASGASALNASNIASGTIDDARLTANVTLNNASTISAGTLADARLTANVTLNNASTISAGTLNNDRLDTVPTTKGGTGLTTLGSAGQILQVAAPGTSLEFADASAGGGNYAMTAFSSPGTYNPPGDMKAIKVTVIGGGGGGGGTTDNPGPGDVMQWGQGGGSGGGAIEYLDAASVTAPVTVTRGAGGSGGPTSGTTGGTSSFGAFCSATGGAGGAPYVQGPFGDGNPPNGINLMVANDTPGSGTGGTVNIRGSSIASALGFGGRQLNALQDKNPGTLADAIGFGGGGGIKGTGNETVAGGTGTAGIVIVEEFF